MRNMLCTLNMTSSGHRYSLRSRNLHFVSTRFYPCLFNSVWWSEHKSSTQQPTWTAWVFVCRWGLWGVKAFMARTRCTINILQAKCTETENKHSVTTCFVGAVWEAVTTLYLWTWVIHIQVARIHILCHDDEGQEVRGAECTRIATRKK